jgi:energy-coupling factor transporter transmembrane protein EcfT
MAPQGRSTEAAWWVLLLALLIIAAVLFQNGWRPFPAAFVVAGAGFLVVAAIALARTRGGRRVRVAAGFGLILVAVVAVIWVIPIVRGPILECVDTDAAICEGTLRSVTVATSGGSLPGTGIEQIFPVTKLRIWEGGCGRAIERSYIFTEASIC